MTIVELLGIELRSEDPGERENALDRLGSLNPPEAVHLAVSLLTDPEYLVRETVVTCLGTLRDVRAIPFLLRVIQHDESEKVRTHAIMSLVNYHAPEILEELLSVLDRPETSSMSRMKVVFQLWKYDNDRAIEALKRSVLDDADPNVRLHAADSLLFLFRLRGCPPEFLQLWNKAAKDNCVGVCRSAERALELLSSDASRH